MCGLIGSLASLEPASLGERIRTSWSQGLIAALLGVGAYLIWPEWAFAIGVCVALAWFCLLLIEQ